MDVPKPAPLAREPERTIGPNEPARAAAQLSARWAIVQNVSYAVAAAKAISVTSSKLGVSAGEHGTDSQIADALREQLALLSPSQIRRNREQLGLSQRDLAEHLGVAVETISRWENGVLIQSRAMDRYLRVYFGVPAARAALASHAPTPSLGAHVQQ